MSAAAPLAAPRARPRASSPLGWALGAIALGALAAAGSGALGVLAPFLLAAALWAAWVLPLRVTGAGLVFLSLALEVSTDAAGLWHTPLAAAGDLLRENLSETVGLAGVKLAGIEVVLLLLLGVDAWRRATGRTIDRAGWIPTAPVVRDAVLVYLAAVLFAFANGLATGGTVALWQLRRLFQVPLYLAFFRAAFRGPRDHALVGRAIVAAGCVKGVLAVVAQRLAVARTGGELAHATNHGDSMLFAVGIVILVLHVLEHPDRARILRAAAPLLLLLLGIKENNRRLAFVELGMALAAVWLLAPAAAWKRKLRRAALLATPLVLLYVAAGWTSTSGRLFGPVRTLRSLLESQSNRSTLWREVENWNIAMSMRERPLLGLGLGKEYTEHAANDDVSFAYREFRSWPHNSILGLLLFGGLFGFTAIWALPALSVFLAVRSLRRAAEPDDRVAALCVVAAVVCCAVQAYGDLGAAFTQHRLLEGLALAVAGKLAVSTGAWPAPAPAASPAAAPRTRRRPSGGGAR